MEIANWVTGAVIYSGDHKTMTECVSAAVRARANLTYADLTDANLTGANLTYANLAYANLTRANLTYANLTDANLAGANLTYSNLTGANLTYANLAGANLTYSNLTGANLTYAKGVCPPMMLLASWRPVSPKLCRELMRYDAANLPSGTRKFGAWARGGACPYTGSQFARVANFQEERKHWKPGPAKTALQLMVMVLREKGCKGF